MVIDAAQREVQNSLDCFLIAYLWQIPGYSLAETSAMLVTAPRRIRMVLIVPHVDDSAWTELTLSTINRSKSSISRPEAVATRASTLPPSPAVFSTLDALVRHAEPAWERHQAAVIAASYITAVRTLAPSSEYLRLRTALEERGLLS